MNIKNFTIKFFLISYVLSHLVACQKDEKIMLHTNKYFTDLDDKTTTSIDVTIPRIEFDNKKSSETTVTFYVSVTDQDGNVLSNFNANNFNLSFLCKGEVDTINIQNHSFTSDNDKRDRIAVGNTMDYSGSMSTQDILDMETAIKQFIRLKDDQDYMQIIKFHSDVFIMNEFTNDTTVLINAVNEHVGTGLTAYYRAVLEGLQEVHSFINDYPKLFPAIIAFTDGYNNLYPYDPDAFISNAKKNQIPIYTMGFGQVNTNVMIKIANETGGRYFYTPSSLEIENLYTTISMQLSNIYSLHTQTLTLECDDLIFIVDVVYESFHGIHKATASRGIVIDNK